MIETFPVFLLPELLSTVSPLHAYLLSPMFVQSVDPFHWSSTPDSLSLNSELINTLHPGSFIYSHYMFISSQYATLPSWIIPQSTFFCYCVCPDLILSSYTFCPSHPQSPATSSYFLQITLSSARNPPKAALYLSLSSFVCIYGSRSSTLAFIFFLQLFTWILNIHNHLITRPAPNLAISSAFLYTEWLATLQ